MESLKSGNGKWQNKLQPDEDKCRLMLENSGYMLWTVDPDFRLQFITNNVERVVHIKASDMIGKPIWKFIAPEYHAVFRDHLERQLKGEDIPAYEVVAIDGSGKRLPFEVKTAAIVNKDGKIIGIEGISRNITGEKCTEEAVRKGEAKFRNLIENIYDWVWETDRNDVFTYSNPRVLDYLGYRPEEVIGKSMYDFMEPEKAKRIRAVLDDMVKHRKQVAIAEKTLISKQGEPVDFEMTANLVYAEDGSLKGFRGICRDIRDRKRAEEAQRKAFSELEKRVRERTEELVHARATLQGILETAPLGIIAVDAKTDNIMFYSPGVEKAFGHPLKGKTYGPEIYPYQLLRPDGSPLKKDELPLFQSLRYGRHVSNMEILVKPTGGREYTLMVSSAPIKDPEGHITAAVATIVDITRLKSTEKELQEAKAQAEMYLDLMGHDINNLNQAGIGYLELALDELHSKGKLGLKDQLYLDKAMETLINSSKLIDNVRKLQRSREGSMKYRPIDLCDVVKELKEYYSNIPERKITIRFSAMEHCCVNANELIRDVFSNLIGNAIKHSSRKKPLEIDIDIKKVTSDEKDFYKITIDDNGPGIPDELKRRLFARFQKGKTKTSGRGLGLYLVKTLLDDFDGSVAVEDRVKGDYRKGSRFVVMLPIASTLSHMGAEACSG